MRRSLFVLIFGVSSVLHVNAQSIDDTASKFIPEGSKLMHKVVEGTFGASAKSIVVLYGEEGAMKSYEGFVLVPKGAEYVKVMLPKPEFTWSVEEPRAVFFANADRDKALELFIIGECYTGIGPTGAQPFHRTRVYDWNGSGFVHLETVSEKIGGASKAAAARKKLGIR